MQVRPGPGVHGFRVSWLRGLGFPEGVGLRLSWLRGSGFRVSWLSGFGCVSIEHFLASWPIPHRPLSSSYFLWFIFRILEGNPKKGLLGGLWVETEAKALKLVGSAGSL